jgi:hypothetical protein
MRIEAKNSKLKPIFELLYDNITKGFIQITEDELIIESATPDTTMMFSINADSEFFDVFNPELEEHGAYREDDKLFIGTYLDEIYPILKKFDSSDKIAIILDETYLTVASGDHVISRKTLELDKDDVVEQVQGIGLESEFSVNAEEFVDSIKKLSYFEGQEPVNALVDDDELFLEIENDVGKGESSMKLIDWNLSDAESMFGIKLIKKLSKGIKLFNSKDDELELRLGDQRPLETVLDKKNLKLRIFLAPRIEEK